MKLIRTDFLESGIFGVLSDDNNNTWVTIEHAYSTNPDGQSLPMVWRPKVEPGAYTCVRGWHRLEPTDLNPNPQRFETFEITGVPGHTNILFHVGNYNYDSEGCVLIGRSKDPQANGDWMISNSMTSFTEFMALLEGINEFTLTVS